VLKKIALSLLATFAIIVCFGAVVHVVEQQKKQKAIDDYVAKWGYYQLADFEFTLEKLHPSDYDEVFGGIWIDKDGVNYFGVTYIDEEICELATKSKVKVVKVKYPIATLLEIQEKIWDLEFEGVWQIEGYDDSNTIKIWVEPVFRGKLLQMLESSEYYYQYLDAIVVIPCEFNAENYWPY